MMERNNAACRRLDIAGISLVCRPCGVFLERWAGHSMTSCHKRQHMQRAPASVQGSAKLRCMLQSRGSERAGCGAGSNTSCRQASAAQAGLPAAGDQAAVLQGHAASHQGSSWWLWISAWQAPSWHLFWPSWGPLSPLLWVQRPQQQWAPLLGQRLQTQSLSAGSRGGERLMGSVTDVTFVSFQPSFWPD